jgi:hypothetical protein
MKFKVGTFQGILPIVEPRRLADNQAQTAQNCDLVRGILSTIKIPGSVSTLPDASRLSIYYYNSAWLSWTTDVDVVKGPINGDQYNRIYYTGSGAPKVRAIISTTETEYTLGVPAPASAPTCTAQAKSAVTWTRTWHYQYEEADGSISQTGTMSEGAYGGANIDEVTPGASYRVETIPAKTTASASATFVMWFDAYDAASSYLGRVYPAHSAYYNNSDFYLSGAQAIATQVNSATSPQATFTLTYDSSRASDYTVDRYYVITYVTNMAEEGAPSAVSAMVSVTPVQDCLLSGLPTTAPSGYPNVEKKRIYRTVSGEAGTTYRYVDEVDLADATFLDTVDDADTGEEMPSTDWETPDSSLAGLVSLPNGMMAAFKDNTVYFCEPYYPHAWPTKYAQTVPEDIVGLGVNSSGLVVLTKGKPYLITGTHPESVSIIEIDSRQACSSKRGIAQLGDSTNAVVIYPSPDGLVVIQGAVAMLYTEKMYRRDQWQALSPTSMIAEVHDGKCFVFNGSQGIIFDFTSSGALPTTTDQVATALYSDIENDILYMVQDAAITSWNTGSTNMTILWKSKVLTTDRRASFSCGRVSAASYPVTLRVYAAGATTAVITRSVTEDKAFRLPTVRDEKEWEIEVEGAVDIYEVLVSNSMGDL